MDAQIEELLLSQLLGTGKSRGSPPCNELRDPCFPSRDRLFREVGAFFVVIVGGPPQWLYEEPNLRHSAPFCATGPHLDRKCARCGCGSPVPSNILKSGRVVIFTEINRRSYYSYSIFVLGREGFRIGIKLETKPTRGKRKTVRFWFPPPAARKRRKGSFPTGFILVSEFHKDRLA